MLDPGDSTLAHDPDHDLLPAATRWASSWTGTRHRKYKPCQGGINAEENFDELVEYASLQVSCWILMQRIVMDSGAVLLAPVTRQQRMVAPALSSLLVVVLQVVIWLSAGLRVGYLWSFRADSRTQVTIEFVQRVEGSVEPGTSRFSPPDTLSRGTWSVQGDCRADGWNLSRCEKFAERDGIECGTPPGLWSEDLWSIFDWQCQWTFQSDVSFALLPLRQQSKENGCLSYLLGAVTFTFWLAH